MHVSLFLLAAKDKKSCGGSLPRMDEDTCLFPVDEKAVEFYFASDARSVTLAPSPLMVAFIRNLMHHFT